MLARLGTFSGNEGYFEAFADGGFSFYDALFPQYTYRVAGPTKLYVAASDTYEIRQFSPAGVLEAIVRRTHAQVPVSNGHVRVERERRLAAAREDERTRLDGVLGRIPVPEVFPAYQLVRVAEDGTLWVQDYPIDASARATWAVFDSTGVLIEELSLPARLEPRHIGRHFVVGTWRDEFDIEHVGVYDLLKP